MGRNAEPKPARTPDDVARRAPIGSSEAPAVPMTCTVVLLERSDTGSAVLTPTPSDDSPANRLERRGSMIAFVMLALFAAFFVAHSWAQIAAPFGDAHDGRNGGTWGLASRAVREDGIFESHGGSRLADGTTYAHHPPLIIAETALSETVTGEHPWSTRLAVWLGSLVTIGLVYVLVRQRGASAIAAAAGTIVAFGTPMFFVYGTMLDTLQTSLPFAVAFLIVWLAREPDDRTRPSWPIIVLGTLLVLASWEGALLVAVATATDLVTNLRRERRITAPPSLWGLLAGIGLTGCWLFWAEGSFSPILDQFLVRSGNSTAAPTLNEFLTSQQAFFSRTFSAVLLVLALPGLYCALRNPRTRRLIIVVLVVTISYPIVMHDAAYHHDYWNYWLLLTFAIACAALIHTILDVTARRDSGRHLMPVTIGCIALVILLAVLGATRDSVPAAREAAGRPAGELARTHGGDLAYLAGNIVMPADWFTYYTHNPDRRLDTTQSIQRAARNTPNVLVLLKCGDELPWLSRTCTRLDIPTGTYRAMPITKLASTLEP